MIPVQIILKGPLRQGHLRRRKMAHVCTYSMSRIFCRFYLFFGKIEFEYFFIEVSIFLFPLSEAMLAFSDGMRECVCACAPACVRECACVGGCVAFLGTPGMGKGVEGPTHPSPPPLNISKYYHRSLFPISTVIKPKSSHRRVNMS